MEKLKDYKPKLSPTKIIALGYLCIIAAGTILLCLPISSRSGEFTPVLDSLFTATSATCVTGLIVHDTYTYWSVFGQIVILIMIQLGGIGFMTLSVLVMSLIGRKIGIRQRSIMQQSVSAQQVGGIVRMTRFIVVLTAIFEALGAIVLSIRFCPIFGIAKGIYFAVFHSVSAFCNAGFDLMGGYSGEFSSLTAFCGDYTVSLTVCLLIICGGFGFYAWADLYNHKFRFNRYSLTTKIVLLTTAILLVGGTAVIFTAEQGGEEFSQMSIPERILAAFFQAVTPRTAGFNTMNLSSLSDATVITMIFLMFVGGSPGSTAGGMKTTSLAILFASIFSTIKRKKAVECFKRRISNDLLLNVLSIFAMFMMLFVASSIIISAVDSIPMKSVMFETASAIGTVGLTLGVTPTLSPVSHLILIVLMYLGRVGCFTVLFALSDNVKGYVSKYPVENITIG